MSINQHLEVAFRTHYLTVRKFLRSHLADKERAEDLTVETFATLRDKLEEGVIVRDGEAYLIEIARGHLQHEIRRLAVESQFQVLVDPATMVRREERALEMGLATPYHPALTIEDVEFQFDHDRAVRALPHAERGAYILTELRGLTVREAAPYLGLGKTRTAELADAARARIRASLDL